jgi:hypothetical protein
VKSLESQGGGWLHLSFHSPFQLLFASQPSLPLSLGSHPFPDFHTYITQMPLLPVHSAASLTSAPGEFTFSKLNSPFLLTIHGIHFLLGIYYVIGTIKISKVSIFLFFLR